MFRVAYSQELHISGWWGVGGTMVIRLDFIELFSLNYAKFIMNIKMYTARLLACHLVGP